MVVPKSKMDRGRVNPQYLANVLTKINMKCGGANHKLYGRSMYDYFPALKEDRPVPFMIVGIDITHPMSFNRSVPSIGAVVGSYDM